MPGEQDDGYDKNNDAWDEAPSQHVPPCRFAWKAAGRARGRSADRFRREATVAVILRPESGPGRPGYAQERWTGLERT